MAHYGPIVSDWKAELIRKAEAEKLTRKGAPTSGTSTSDTMPPEGQRYVFLARSPTGGSDEKGHGRESSTPKRKLPDGSTSSGHHTPMARVAGEFTQPWGTPVSPGGWPLATPPRTPHEDPSSPYAPGVVEKLASMCQGIGTGRPRSKGQQAVGYLASGKGPALPTAVPLASPPPPPKMVSTSHIYQYVPDKHPLRKLPPPPPPRFPVKRIPPPSGKANPSVPVSKATAEGARVRAFRHGRKRCTGHRWLRGLRSRKTEWGKAVGNDKGGWGPEATTSASNDDPEGPRHAHVDCE